SEVARVFRNAQVELVGRAAGGWAPVRLWNALVGWLPTAALTVEPYPDRDARPGGGYRRAIAPNPVASAAWPLDVPAFTTLRATVSGAPGGRPVGGLAGDAPVRLVGYQT